MKKISLTSILLLALGANAQNLQWVNSTGTVTDDEPGKLVVDSQGNTYAVGNFNGTMDADPGPGVYTLTSTGALDGYILKYNSAGALLWAFNIGGPSNDATTGIALDTAENIIVTGRFMGTCDFDPSGSTANSSASGNTDIYLAKYSSAGAYIWMRRMGGTNSEEGLHLAVNNMNRVTVTGYFRGSVDFDPSAGSDILNSSGSAPDMFIAQYDELGAHRWARRIGGTGDEYGRYIAVDYANNIYCTGDFSTNNCDFDPGAGVLTLANNGGPDAFFLKLDSDGNYLVAKRFGSLYYDYGLSLSVNNYANGIHVLMTGYFSGNNVDFDPGAGTLFLTSNGMRDMFIVDLNVVGGVFWAQNIGGTAEDEGLGVTRDAAGNAYVCGYFKNTVDFDPGSGVTSLSGNGSTEDGFVAKYNYSGGFEWVRQFTSNNNDRANNIALGPNGALMVTGAFSTSCDFAPANGSYWQISNGMLDVFVAKYSTCSPQASVINVTACGSYTSPDGNEVWISSGVYYDTISTLAGCDSTMTINLTIAGSTGSTISANGCPAGYTSPSGNHIWYTSGTYNDTIPNSIGCDSIITVTLTINSLDLSVTNNSPSLVANQNGASYQWIDCNNANALIPGETNQTFNAQVNGAYAVIITYNNCSDTSVCETVFNTSIPQPQIDAELKVYPNPASTEITISIPAGENAVILDLSGRVVMVKQVATHGILDVRELPSGSYIITDSTSSRMVRFVKH